MEDLKDRVVLITGAGRGIGRAMALAFARCGARVAIQDIELEVAREVAALAGPSAVAIGGEVGGDITLPETAEQIVSQVRRQLGEVQVLVNNAGVQEAVHWTETKQDRLEWMWRGNVLAPWNLTKLCLPAMKAAKWGRVINISSIQGKRGYPDMLGYSVTKSALNNFTLTVAAEVARDGVTVNAIAPGYFDTHRNRWQFPDAETKAKRGEWLPARRVGEPEDVVGAALMLASDAGAYITGQILYVDGGMSLIR